MLMCANENAIGLVCVLFTPIDNTLDKANVVDDKECDATFPVMFA